MDMKIKLTMSLCMSPEKISFYMYLVSVRLTYFDRWMLYILLSVNMHLSAVRR